MRRYGKLISLILAALMILGCFTACGGGDDSSSSAPPDVPWLPDIPESGSDSSEPESVSEPESISEPEVVSSESVSVSSEPETQPAPTFVDGSPAASLSGKTVTVTVKTDVASTVNAILSTNGAGIGTAAFYDYFNRGKALDGALEKSKVYDVDSGGKGISFTLPDFTKAYYVLLNAAENASGTWQGGVTVLKVYDPSGTAPGFVTTINQKNTQNDNLIFQVESTVPVTVYCLVCPSSSAAPNAKQVKAGGEGFTGTVTVKATATSNSDKAPYVAQLQIPRSSLAAGSYTGWVTLQSTAYPDAPLSEPGKFVFSM